VDEFGHARFGGVGYYIGKEIEKRFENIDTRAVVLGHLQRGGSPIAFDRVLATRFGIAAIDLVHECRFGEMVAIRGNAVVSLPLKNVVGKRKNGRYGALRHSNHILRLGDSPAAPAGNPERNPRQGSARLLIHARVMVENRRNLQNKKTKVGPIDYPKQKYSIEAPFQINLKDAIGA